MHDDQRRNAPAEGRLERFGAGIWLASGTPCTVAGFRYPTRMAVMRRQDGELLIWSPISLSEALRREVERLGVVRHLVAPNALHHMFLPEWIDAFPDAEAHAAPGLIAKRDDIAFDHELSDDVHPGLRGVVEQTVIGGNLITTEVVFFHIESKTVLFTDLIQHFPHGWFTGWRAMVARLDRMTGPQPAVPNKFRLAFVDRKAARGALRLVLNWPAENVVFAHGDPVAGDGEAFLKSAFAWLIR